MKQKFVLMVCGLALAVALNSCYYDVAAELYPEGSCDTGNVTYAQTIAPMLTTYSCLSCHSGASASGGISLEGYANVKIKVNDGRLLGAIRHDNGFSPMPQGMPKMSACDINKVKAWIDAGAPNN